MMFDLMLKRGITALVTTYMRARSAGVEHTPALKSVLSSYRGLSPKKQERVWHGFQHPSFVELSRPSNDRDLSVLILLIILEAKGPFDDEIIDWVTKQIGEVTFELKEKYSFQWG